MGIGIRLVAALLLILCALRAEASGLYRCTSPSAITYTSTRIAGQSCKAVTNIKTPSGRKVRPVEPAPLAAESNAGYTLSPLSASSDAKPTRDITVANAAPVKPTSGGPRRVSGQVYSYMKNGTRYVTSVPPAGMKAGAIRTINYSFMESCFACDVKSTVNFRTLRLNTNAFAAEIAEASRMYGVEESIIRAIIHAESAYNPRALSRVGAQGLMQLMPATARRFGVSNAFDPGSNIKGGVQYLAWLLKRFKGDLSLMAAGYNAGEGAVGKYGGVPPYAETRVYVQRVRMLADRYRNTPRQD
ncbi:lytic transglycosylase domain-containing protein [Lysobacter soyae]|uniref:Lytic transglycosylase domain-containing protein n=1 Tax=Lysobacter soyae TaxID=2764185 RepID=A0ABX8WM98_9GAMM|nr:lytic transglycosylase domain-containing protein [Lysobacter sp. CJ11]QYR52558.1 lytic transglycosylase domain-containing protein [Lysobacter sp. CJ11]